LSRCQIFDFNRIRVEDMVGRLTYVAKNEAVTAEEEALHIIAQKADGALRDALSIFDQIVSLCGKKVTYKDVIANLNVLDYEYYFKSVDGALEGDVSTVLLTFNEILEKGFDGHNFVSGLNSHLRDLLVSKDESTLRLLETTPAVRQRYLMQSSNCPVEFLYKALEAGSNCDISYKNSKNPRLHVELFLIRMCRLSDEPSEEAEKKNLQLNKSEKELKLPSKSEIIRESEEPVKNMAGGEEKTSSHMPVIEKPARTFSIKEIISETMEPETKVFSTVENQNDIDAELPGNKLDFTPGNISSVWMEFIKTLSSEGPRIVSMFKSIVPEMEDEHTLKVHLSNAAQKDLFIQNYKQRLLNYLGDKFADPELEIETSVDLSDTNDLLYTDEQKYNYLQKKYPVLKDFKKTFNLDIT
jgi:DNA polymerase-3 subunit gamma/tau